MTAPNGWQWGDPITDLPEVDMTKEELLADTKTAEVILAAWRKRFPPNMYAWPTADMDFAIEAVRALRVQLRSKDMTSKDAMIIGERLAIQHKKDVLKLIEMGATPERALHGCLVSLAACIMVELQKATEMEDGHDREQG